MPSAMAEQQGGHAKRRTGRLDCVNPKRVAQWECFFRLAFETAARRGELADARWEEFDVEGRIWTAPGVRGKLGRARLIPLTLGAVEALREMRGVSDPSNPRVFHALGECRIPRTSAESISRSLGFDCDTFSELRTRAKVCFEAR